MTATTISSKQLNQMEEHQVIIEPPKNIIELLAMPEAADIDFEPPSLTFTATN